MTSEWAKKLRPNNETSTSRHSGSDQGTTGRLSIKHKRHHGNIIKSSDNSTEDEVEVIMMEKIERAFEKAIDCKFARIEERIMQMEEKSEKMYKIMVSKDYSDKTSCSEESLYRDLIDLIERNTDEGKQTSKTLDALNAKQNDLIENTEDLIEKTSKIQKSIKGLQKHSPSGYQASIHSDHSSTPSNEENATKRTWNNLELSNRIDGIQSSIDDVQEQMDAWAKYSNENTNRMLEKLTSMAQVVEATTVQGKVMHDNMSQRIENIGTTLDKSLSSLTKLEEDVNGAKSMHNNMNQRIDNIADTLNQRLVPFMNDTNRTQKSFHEEAKQMKELLDKTHETVMETKEHGQLISNEQNLENLSNIMASLTTLTQETSSLQTGMNEILNYKLAEDFVQGMCAMMNDNKTILQNLVDKKSLSNINNTLNDIKLNDVKMNMQIKEIKNICSTLCSDVTLKDLIEEVKGMQVNPQDVASDIKKHENERFNEIKTLIQKLTKAQSKLGEKPSPKKKPGSDDSSVHSMLLQMEIKKASAEQTKLTNTIHSKLVEISENQASHHQSMANFTSSVDSGINNMTKKLDSQMSCESTKITDNIKSSFIEHFKNIIEEFKKYSNIHSEILNSIEDLKQLTSSMPHTVNDLVPLIEKAVSDIQTFPDEVNNCFAGLEENLCANLEGRVKQISLSSLKEIADRFDTVEQRLLVIRKYAKHGGNGGGGQCDSASTSNEGARDDNRDNFTSQCNDMISILLERVDAVYNVAEQNLSTSTILEKDIGQLRTLVPTISDMKQNYSNEKILEMAEDISKQLGTTCKDSLDLSLTSIRDLQYQILEQQAKADVVEEQFLALADEIMPRVKELKVLEDRLIKFCENSLDPITHHLKVATKGDNMYKDDPLNILSSFNQLEERLTSNQNAYLNEILQNIKANPKSQRIYSQPSMTNKSHPVDGNSKNMDHKKSSSGEQVTEYKTSAEIRSSSLTASGSNRAGRQQLLKTCLAPSTLKLKDTNTHMIRQTNIPTRTRKRTPSSSTDDSILDTNSEISKKSSFDRKGRPWGPKRKRPYYDESDSKNAHGGENNAIDIDFREKDFDCSSTIVSEDAFL